MFHLPANPTLVKQTFLALLWTVCLQTYLPIACCSATEGRPNVLIVLSDDQGWGDLSVNGNINLSTPNIDSLAREGASFDRFYVCPVCSPTRAEFLTGRYHARGGVYSTSSGGERLNLDEVTIADMFRADGYTTGAFGKWHNGMQYPYHPCGRGFNEYYGFCSGHWGDYYSPMLEHNGQIVQGNGFCIDDFTEHAIKFMSDATAQDKPFFAYLPFNTPHAPMQVPDEYWDRFREKELQLRAREPESEDVPHTRAALAMCENIDWNVGRLLEHLEQQKIADNTIVLYFCDNGPNGNRWNGDMKGRKGSTDEGGVRSPLFIRWPGKIPSGHTLPIAAAIDLLPTLAELAQVPLTNEKPLDGISLAGLLTGEQSTAPDRHILSMWNKKTSVRTQRFRLDTQGQLFEIARDPGQRENVAAAHAQETQRLQAIADDFRQQIRGFDQDERPFPLGHSDFRFTQIPARDARPIGNLERSNRFPNCTYFLNWTSTEDALEWDVEVLAAGKFLVELQYACPAEDLGSKLLLTCGKSRLVSQITEACDPPLRGQEHDRVLRPESYIKDFCTMQLGVIELEPGPQRLTLSATEIPRSQALEFRLMMFIRQ